MTCSQTYYLLDGQVLVLNRWPRTVTSQKGKAPPKRLLQLTDQEVEVEPIAGLPDCWRETGLQGKPPAPEDMITGWETPLAVIDLPLAVIDLPLESAIRKGKWLVDTIIGLLWIVRAFDTLPIWKLAPENSECL